MNNVSVSTAARMLGITMLTTIKYINESGIPTTNDPGLKVDADALKAWVTSDPPPPFIGRQKINTMRLNLGITELIIPKGIY